jgi:hypothetical protein
LSDEKSKQGTDVPGVIRQGRGKSLATWWQEEQARRKPPVTAAEWLEREKQRDAGLIRQTGSKGQANVKGSKTS